jgi:hypothetical protein
MEEGSASSNKVWKLRTLEMLPATHGMALLSAYENGRRLKRSD